ncbi:DUF365 domain-containing protein [Archaeoglobus sulfaticallidus]|nr:DUF365 domain-containing protein [Archaeoglobus sulfaticallidus]
MLERGLEDIKKYDKPVKPKRFVPVEGRI